METPGQVYLNTAACGLISPASLAAATQLYQDMATNASTRSEYWRDQEQPIIRQKIAAFVGASNPDSIALLPNFSWGINGIIQSLKGTEKVLMYGNDYPSFTEPFRINKFDIAWVGDTDGFSLPVDEISDTITKHKVDIVALSHVQWNSGYKADLLKIGNLCREHDILFFVDATQSMGAIDINLSKLHIDVLGGSNYKWMNGGFGAGFMYVSNNFMKKYTPAIGGNNSYKMIDGRLQYVPSVQSYEPGHANMFGHTLAAAAIGEKNSIGGIAKIEAHNTRLTQLLLDKLEGIPVKWLGGKDMDNRAPILFFKDEDGLGSWLQQHNIIVTHRNGYLRTSMHFHNTETDITALIDCLKAKFS